MEGSAPTGIAASGSIRRLWSRSDWVDPFVRPNPAREGLVRVVTSIALVWGALYLLWRVATTLDGTAALSAAFLLVAEILGLAVFAGRAWSASASPIVAADAPDAPRPGTTAVIDASSRSIDELRTTLVSTRRVYGLEGVIVVDRDESRWLRTIAERFGAAMAGPDKTLGEVVAGVSTPWVLRMRAGDLPMPDLLTMTAPACSAPDVGVVQVGIEEADPTSYEHDPGGLWSLDPFDHEVVRPSLASRGSIPWYGDGPVMVRTAAIGATGVADDDLSDAARGVALRLCGYRISYVPLTLARVRGPRTLSESLQRRWGHLAPRAKVAFSPDVRRLAPKERAAHRLAVVPLVSAVQRLALVVAAVTTMGLAQQPLNASGADLVVMAVPAYLLRWSAHLLLGRGRLAPFSILRSDLRSIGVDITLLSERRRGQERGLGLLMALAVALHFVVAVTAISVWRDWPDRLPAEVAVVALVISSGFLGVAMEAVLDAVLRRQRRAHHRVRLGLVTCRLQEFEGHLVNLSTGGAGVVVDCAIDEAPQPGSVTTIAFRIPDADGAWRNVSTLVHIAHRMAEGAEATRLGLTFDDPTDSPLDPVVEFLTIDRRLLALGRRNLEPAA